MVYSIQHLPIHEWLIFYTFKINVGKHTSPVHLMANTHPLLKHPRNPVMLTSQILLQNQLLFNVVRIVVCVCGKRGGS